MQNGKQKKVVYTITTEDFINWYYFDGSDQESKKSIYDLGEMTIAQFLKKKPIKLKPIFKDCNHSIIPGKYIQECKKSKEFKNEELDFIEHKLGVKIKLKLI